MAVSLKDVATLARVSTATASLALNNKPVNIKTRERVLAAAKKLNYYPDQRGRALATGSTNTLGLFILNKVENTMITEEVAFFYPLLRGVMEAVHRQGYAFEFAVEWFGTDSNIHFEKFISSKRIDGVMVLPQWQTSQSQLGKLVVTGVPHVIINPIIFSNQQLQVAVDNKHGAELAVRHLVSHGYTEIGLIAGPEEHIDSINRVQSYYETMASVGLAVNGQWLERGDFSIESGYHAMQKILAANPRPRAMFCTNDYMASGAMRAVLEQGFNVPEDMAFVGFDDTDVASAVYPQLTTVRQPLVDLGRSAADLLLSNLLGRKEVTGPIIHKPTLVVRNSCGYCNEKSKAV